MGKIKTRERDIFRADSMIYYAIRKYFSPRVGLKFDHQTNGVQKY